MIEVGEYVRTKNGIIDRIKTINRYGTVTKYDDKEDKISIAINYYINSGLEVNKDDIVKHSKNIIDVIKAGDIVNEDLIVYKGRVANEEEKLLVGNYTINGMALEVVNVKTVQTKEQYVQNCYTVERNEEC